MGQSNTLRPGSTTTTPKATYNLTQQSGFKILAQGGGAILVKK